MGATSRVKDGYRIDWIPGSIRLFEDITRQVGEIRAEAKAQEPPDLVLDKTRQGNRQFHLWQDRASVAGTRIIKDDIEQRHVFNTKFGVTDQMGPSAITNAMMAAYCTGLVRALLTGDANAAAGRDMGRDGNHRRFSVHLRSGGYRPERAGGDGVQGGARAHHAGRRHDLGGEAFDPRGRS